MDAAVGGDYEFELRRWPREADAAISAGVPEQKDITPGRGIAGVALPITRAKIYIDGVNHLSVAEKRPYGFEGLVQQVRPEDKFTVFHVKLEKGPTYLHTWFDDKYGENICGAYYVYVHRK